MPREYFLGGNTSNGYRTAFFEEQKGKYGYYLKGGPGTGKSTILKTIAAEFREESVSIYHCSSDPSSLDAVVLEERGVFIVDATAPHEQNIALPYITGEHIDLAACLNSKLLQANYESVLGLHTENLAAHQRARRGLVGISAMQDTVWDIGKKALLSEKLMAYARRLAKRVLATVKTNPSEGRIMERQTAALTPDGWLTFVPEGYDTIVLEDSLGCAASVLLALFSEVSAAQGICCEVTRATAQTDAPILHLVIPDLKVMLLTVTPFAPCNLTPTNLIRIQRFYDAEQLKSKRNLIKFCVKNAESIRAYTQSQLKEALSLHDALEEYYISAQNRKKLNARSNALIAELRQKS